MLKVTPSAEELTSKSSLVCSLPIFNGAQTCAEFQTSLEEASIVRFWQAKLIGGKEVDLSANKFVVSCYGCKLDPSLI